MMQGLKERRDVRRAQAWFKELRDTLCGALEDLEARSDSRARFVRSPWKRKGGGGGETALLAGSVFEKAGVHVSAVYGALPKALKDHLPAAAKARRFWAGGVSFIAHPRNPHAPSAHMNTRMIVMDDRLWFGGGADLTPTLASARRASHPDTRRFHAAFKTACETYRPHCHERFKKECARYFYLPHRGHERGTGGIFFDYLNSGETEDDFAFVKAVGSAFLKTYPPIVAGQAGKTATDEERREQLFWRARYAEFNLLYDRGTQFGLKTGGNVEAILSSLPPLAAWP